MEAGKVFPRCFGRAREIEEGWGAREEERSAGEAASIQRAACWGQSAAADAGMSDCYPHRRPRTKFDSSFSFPHHYAQLLLPPPVAARD